MAQPETPSRDLAAGTQSLGRAVSLLREVAAHGDRGARLTDLVADTGFAKPTVRRLLAAMIRERLLEQDGQTRRYYLGSETFVLGNIAASRFGVHRLDSGALARLAAMSQAKYAGSAIPLAALLCDRHAETGDGRATALLYENAAGHTSRLSYADLLDHSKRFAGVLQSLGVERGARVATLLSKGPELLVTVVALWRLGAVHVPLFTAFGAQAIAYRLEHSGTSVVVTNGAFRNKLRDETPTGLSVVTVESEGASAAHSGDVLFWSALHGTAPVESVASLSGDDSFVLLYTAGTAGAPRGLPVPVKALAAIEMNMRLALDVRDDDVYWHIADPGWGGGLYYAVLGPLLLGRTTIFCDGPFDAGQVYRVLTKYGVTNLLAAPNWYRALRAAESMNPPPAGLRLRVASSVGDQLPDDLIDWVAERLGPPLHDHYGQIELGMVVVNHHAPALQRPRRRGSIGRSSPGVRVVALDAAGREVAPGQEGELAVDVEKSPLFWFGGYYNDPDSTAERFRHGRRYYLTGDLVRTDADGYFYYLGTMDEVITSAGYLIGPAEVESALGLHAAVAEAAVIGKPDRLLGEVVKAFVILKPGYAPSAELSSQIARHVKERLPAYAYAPEIEFVTALPRTADGKLHRFALRDNASTGR